MIDENRRAVVTGGVLGAAALMATGAIAQSTGNAVPTADPDRPLQGRVAFITGGARGIGLASALELARLGADVALVDIADPNGVRGVQGYRLSSREDLAAAERQVRALGGRAISIVADVRNPTAMELAAARTASELGGLDIVVTSAGIFNIQTDNLDAFTLAVWSSMIDVNVLGVINTVRAALPGLRTSRNGRVILLSSISGRAGNKDAMVYSTTKWAVNGLMKSIAEQLGPSGITVNAVAPSPVETVLLLQGRDRDTVERSTAQESILPIGMLAPIDIARAVAFFAGPGGRGVSGGTIDVNAGRSVHFTG